MGLHRQWEDENEQSMDFSTDKHDLESDEHRRKIRKCIEDRLEKKRLRDEIDELDGDFEWDDLDQ